MTGAARATTDAAARADRPGPVTIEAPEPPRRVRRPLDLARLLVALAGLGLALLIGAMSVNTVAGIGADVTAAIRPLPGALIVIATATSGLMLLALPVAIVGDLLLRRRFRVFTDTVLTALLAFLLAGGARLLLVQSEALAPVMIGTGAGAHPLNGVIAAVVAMATVVRIGQRDKWRVLAAGVLALVSVAMVIIGFTTLAIVVSLLLGRVVGLAVRWAAGSPPSRPSPREVVDVLRRLDIEVTSLRPRLPDARDPALFDVRDVNGRSLVVYVLDHDHVGSGLLVSLWRTVRIRQPGGWWTLLSLRRTLEHLALVSMAVAAAGARTQRLVGAVPVEPDAALLAYEDVVGVTFDAASPEDLTDARLDAAWEQVGLLHRRAIAHRDLDAANLVATPDGATGVRITGAGQVAAGETALRIDLAHLLVTLGLLVGADRAVASALRVVGPERLATALPLLQPIVLGHATRRQLREHSQLLDEIREEILDAVPTAPVEPVNVERLRLRTLVSAVALTIAAYVLVSQVAGLDLLAVVGQADGRWMGVAALFAALRYVGAAAGLVGFVAERLPFLRTILVQVAASFLGLVAPAGVGGAALNVRFLQRSGVPAAAAVASVALWQAGTFVMTVIVLVVLNVISGANQTELLSVPPEAMVALAVVIAIGAVIVAVPAGRKFVTKRLRPYLSQVRPRIGSVLTRPGRLVTGLAGTLLQTVTTVLVMWACVDAFGESVPLVLVAVIVLAGTALASAAPTPGGLGAVEAVLATGLTAAAGLDGAVAVSSVLLFRLLTFWLPVVPGWLAFTTLQRRDAV